MKRLFLILCTVWIFSSSYAQTLRLKLRKVDAIGGKAFANSIADSSLRLADREQLIFNEIKNGNVPDFLRTLTQISYTIKVEEKSYTIDFFVVPDYIAIGSNSDYIYMPMTPILAQRVATLTKCALPTRKIVDLIYQNAVIKLEPQPIPPTNAMTTLPIFIVHNDLVKKQLIPFTRQHNNSELIAGHKKDVIISPKIYGEKTPRVVIYGWHQLNGKPIQPLYNKHVHIWADYSHGVRLIQSSVWVNGKKTTLQKVLADVKLHPLLSDEGQISAASYPVFKTY